MIGVNRNFLHLLRVIKGLKKDEFETLIDYLNDKNIDHICECLYNVLNTDLRLKKTQVTKLKTHIKKNMNKKRLRVITNKKASLLKKRKALKQEGRGLPLLLASVIPFLANLFMPK